ncbi:MAG: hypothetical protein JNM95_04385 [Chitinophagaceae bacterium]|nr:hypothetical protein [Chitinophagaceae bacterium]
MALMNKNMRWLVYVGIILSTSFGLQSCHVYSFTGAAIEGKTINIHLIENKAPLNVPTLSPTFTQKLRQRIISQSSLSQLNSETTDYVIEGYITNYDISVAAISGTETTSKNRLTIGVHIDFKNMKNEKANFSQNFSRFADFNADQNLQAIENNLINDISDQLADDIFNKAFVNW